MVAEITMSGANAVTINAPVVCGFGSWGNARNTARPLVEGNRRNKGVQGRINLTH
jgi:hypothetical protein